MTRRFVWIAAGIVLSVAGRAEQQPAQPGATTQPGSRPAPRRITLEEAVRLGIGSSKALGIAAEAVSRAGGVIRERQAARLPVAGVQADFTRLDQGSSVTFPDEQGRPVEIPIVRQNQKNYALAVTMPIDLLGQLRNAVKLAEFLQIGARLDYNRQRNQVVLEVKNAYYDVLRARAFADVADQALKNARDRLSTAEAYLRAGTGTRFDVLRAQTDVADAEQNLIAANNRISLATAALNNAIGLDQNTPTEVVEEREQPVVETDFDKALAEAYTARPEILQSEAQIRAAEKGVDVARASVLPPLSLSWNYQYQPDAGGFAPRKTSWAALARVQIPLFDGGLTKARTQQAKADEAAARLTRQSTLDTVALDVRQAYLGVVEAQERLKVTTAALEQAREQYRLAQVRFREGVTLVPGASPLLEISDAQTALTQAQNNHVSALYDLQNATARLDRAMGRYAYDGAAAPGFAAPKRIE